MRKILSLVLSLLMVFSLMPMTMVSADTITATHVYTMDEGNRIVNGYTKYHWSPGFVDIGDDHGYVYRSETKADAYAYFRLPAGWSTDYGKVTKISFELGGATSGYFNNPGFMLATGVDSNYKYTGAVRGVWSNVSWTAGSWTKVEIDVSDKDTFIIDGTEARYMCFGQQKSLGVQNSSDKTKGWFYIDNLTLTYEVEADLPEYDITIDGEVVDTVMETKSFTVPTPAEGYHYTDGTTDYFGGEEITVTGPVALTSVINTYDVTVDGAVVGTIAHGSTFTVPTPATGYDYTDGTNTYVGGEEITITGPVALTSVVATASYTYTMDEGSRIVSGSTNTVSGVQGKFMEVDGDWVFALPSKGDQYTNFQLPEDWFKMPYHKAVGISFSIARTSNASNYTNYVRFADTASGTGNYVSLSDGYQAMKSSYSVAVDESVYGYRWFSIFLKGGTNYSDSNQQYIYIDDVTVNFEYDFSYVGYDVTIDGEKKATIANGDTYTVPTPATGSYYTDGTNTYVGGEEITVTAPVVLTSKLYEYDVTVDGEVVATIAYGSTYTVEDIENYYITDGTTNYYGGEEITVTGPVVLTTKPETSSIVYTMDEGSRIAGGSTQACTPSGGVYEEVDGDWVFKLPSKADQPLTFILPEYWYEKENCKAVSIEFSVAKTSGGADATQWVEFTNGTDSITISDGYTDLQDKYSVAVDESVYDYRTFKLQLKGGSNFYDAKDYIYIDDVTVNFEYDPDYTAPVFHKVTIDGVEVAEVRDGKIFVLPAAPEGKQYVDGYTAGQEFTVTEALAFFTEDIPVVAPVVSVSAIAGAGVRFNEVTGLRFKATVDAAAVEEAIALGYTVTMGTLIAPADVIGSFDALTFEADENNYLDVVTTGYYNEEAGVVAGTISNIKEANWGRTFMARAYVKLTKDNETVIYYAQQENARSLKEVALLAIDDETVVYNTAQLDLLDKWSKAQAWA